MLGSPMAGDIHTASYPHPVVRFEVIEEALQRAEAAGAADQAAMQADRQHLRRFRAFFVEHVERITQVLEERLAMIENGIFVEAKQQESGVPSMAIIILVGLGLATLMIGNASFLGFALLFIGVGLIARDRLLRHKKSVTGRLKTGRLKTEHLESNQLEENKPKQQQAPDDETWN